MRTPLRLLSILASPLVAFGAIADPASPPATQPVKITLHPSALSRPVMKYRLVPDEIDLTPGNAAIMYLLGSTRNLMTASTNPETAKDLEALGDWLNAPPGGLDRPRAEHLLAQFTSALRQVELGAWREKCDWDLSERIEGYNTLLPHLSELRQHARLLALKARLQIIDRKFDEAAHTLQIGFAMAQHLNRDAFLIQDLVAAAIAAPLLDQVQFWIETPGSPNLYWPLTDLPSPFINMRSATDRERASAYYSIPHMKEAAAGKLTGEHLQEMMAKLTELQAMSEGQQSREKEGALANLKAAGAMAIMLPKANAYLVEMGYTPEALKAMQPAQAIGLWWTQSYDDMQQDMCKAFGLPLHQAVQMKSTTAESDRQKNSANPLTMLFAATGHARLSLARVDRRIAELRTLELVRAYAAGHDGTPPDKLTGLAELPPPLDPYTSAPFSYRIENGTITLDIPMPPDGQPRDARQDQVRLEK